MTHEKIYIGRKLVEVRGGHRFSTKLKKKKEERKRTSEKVLQEKNYHLHEKNTHSFGKEGLATTDSATPI